MSSRARAEPLQAGTPNDATIYGWIDEIRDAIAFAALKRDLQPRDFAATLLCAISTPEETAVIHVGDGSIVGQDAANGDWVALSWPAHGEYASTTNFVTDEVSPNVVITRHQNRLSALVAFTDGLERLALDFTNKRPHAPFFDGIIRPVLSSHATGRDRQLSAELVRYLNTPAVNDRTDDDKTLLVAVFR